jgi:hypothetical protein
MVGNLYDKRHCAEAISEPTGRLVCQAHLATLTEVCKPKEN